MAIGQAQESDIVGYAQNASSKYVEAQTNEIDLLSTYETTLETLAAEKVVLTYAYGVKITILPKTAKVIVEIEDDGEKLSYPGTFTVEELTQELVNDVARDGMPTSVDSYAYAINVVIPESGERIVLITKNKEFYADGEKLKIVTYSVSDDTMAYAVEKYTNTIGE